LADALAQSSAGRGAVGGAIIGGAVGGRRGAAVGAIAGAAAGSRRPLLLAPWSLLGPHAPRIASGRVSILLRPVCRPLFIRPRCRLAPAILSAGQPLTSNVRAKRHEQVDVTQQSLAPLNRNDNTKLF
jgi:hypothetical protein